MGFRPTVGGDEIGAGDGHENLVTIRIIRDELAQGARVRDSNHGTWCSASEQAHAPSIVRRTVPSTTEGEALALSVSPHQASPPGRSTPSISIWDRMWATDR